MYLEAELPITNNQLSKEYATNQADLKREIGLAYVEKVDETGRLLIRFQDFFVNILDIVIICILKLLIFS